MEIEKIREMKNETERVNAVYNWFNEDSRLNWCKAARIEFITTTSYIDKYLKYGDRILDIGAGAGEYSLHYAAKGYDVTSVELADANIEAFKKKITPNLKVDLRQGNAIDLSVFDDNTFDIVLLFGPLYHLEKECDRQKCIKEAMRVCKKDGTIFVAFINHDMIFLTEFYRCNTYFKEHNYNHKTMKLDNFPFIFFTVDESKCMLNKASMHIEKIIASDGASELLTDKINEMDEESYNQYIKYHLYICEKPEFLGMSNHLLYICKK
ncbi:class I SAM-dependent methyltransferase [Sedimentibacter sp. zth1]|uniref:class I SAM-dependent methyltransferase n=1 Tax=Sedimentibacter sp. zth1 TaxID=2816908 RepID=UPI001A91ADFB|nr:class I SAM-dependent methyltransferase [Sedimentibacter sp. zth1]QSX06535.1 class I SAM-dependent methyltransferase [Sedimentibacter sp. zth1]